MRRISQDSWQGLHLRVALPPAACMLSCWRRLSELIALSSNIAGYQPLMLYCHFADELEPSCRAHARWLDVAEAKSNVLLPYWPWRHLAPAAEWSHMFAVLTMVPRQHTAQQNKIESAE